MSQTLSSGDTTSGTGISIFWWVRFYVIKGEQQGWWRILRGWNLFPWKGNYPEDMATDVQARNSLSNNCKLYVGKWNGGLSSLGTQRYLVLVAFQNDQASGPSSVVQSLKGKSMPSSRCSSFLTVLDKAKSIIGLPLSLCSSNLLLSLFRIWSIKHSCRTWPAA